MMNEEVRHGMRLFKLALPAFPILILHSQFFVHHSVLALPPARRFHPPHKTKKPPVREALFTRERAVSYCFLAAGGAGVAAEAVGDAASNFLITISVMSMASEA